MFRALVLLLCLVLAFAPMHAQAQNVQRVLILHDVQDDGYTYVGTPSQFAFMLVNQDGSPNVHKNGRVVVTQNGVILYETLGYATAHDYDALNPFLVTFPSEGPYTIEAEIGDASNPIKASFSGYVEKRPDLVPVSVKFDGSPGPAGTLSKFSYQVVDANGSLVQHSDAQFEVRRASDNFLLFRTHTHSHDSAMVAEYAFPEAGNYVVRVFAFQAYPTKVDTAFAPLVFTKPVTVAAGQPSAPGAPTPRVPGAIPATMAPKPAEGKYVLYTTYDPDRTVGPYGNIRLNALLYDTETKAMAPHVDFDAVLTNPQGAAIFRSQTLHEYDGHLEVLTQNTVVGTYTLDVVAKKGGTTYKSTLTFDVVPPAVTPGQVLPSPGAPGTGPMIITSSPLTALKSGQPQPITLTSSTVAGNPYPHSEIDVQILDKNGVPLYMNKLHTHSDGKFQFSSNFPIAGDYTFVFDAESIHEDFAPSYHYGQLGGKLSVPVKVMAGPEFPNVPIHTPIVEPEQGSGLASGPSFLLLAFVLIGALGFHGRRP